MGVCVTITAIGCVGDWQSILCQDLNLCHSCGGCNILKDHLDLRKRQPCQTHDLSLNIEERIFLSGAFWKRQRRLTAIGASVSNNLAVRSKKKNNLAHARHYHEERLRICSGCSGTKATQCCLFNNSRVLFNVGRHRHVCFCAAVGTNVHKGSSLLAVCPCAKCMCKYLYTSTFCFRRSFCIQPG